MSVDNKKIVVPTTDASEVTRNIITLANLEQFEKLISDAGNKVILVEFYADWCGPCRLMASVIEDLAQSYGNERLFVIKVNIEDFEEFSINMGVVTTPTFAFYRNRVKIEQFFGSKSEVLKEKVDRICGEAAADNKPLEQTKSVAKMEKK